MSMRFKESGVAFLLGVLFALQVTGAERSAELDRAEEWELAGINRESAAAHMQSEADLLSEDADLKLRDREGIPTKRRAVLAAAASMCFRAGNLYGTAAGNLDHAAENWGKSAASFVKLELPERARIARERATHAQTGGTVACRLAAESYEKAAIIYADSLLNDSPQAAKANEKAAAWRENLATRH